MATTPETTTLAVTPHPNARNRGATVEKATTPGLLRTLEAAAPASASLKSIALAATPEGPQQKQPRQD